MPKAPLQVTWNSLREQQLWAPDKEEMSCVLLCGCGRTIHWSRQEPGTGAWLFNSRRVKMCKAHGVRNVLHNGQSSCYLFFYLEA